MLRVFLYAVVLYAGLGFCYFAFAQSIPATLSTVPATRGWRVDSFPTTASPTQAGACSLFQTTVYPDFTTAVHSGQCRLFTGGGNFSSYDFTTAMVCPSGTYNDVVGNCGQQYTCPSGYTLNGTMCDPVNSCANRPDEGQAGWYTSLVGQSSAGSYCSGGCSVTLLLDLSQPEYFTDGKTITVYLKKSYSGQSCTADNAPVPDNPNPSNKTDPPCAPGEGVMTSSTGKISCVPAGTPGSNVPTYKKEQVTTTGPNGETITKDKITTRDPATGVETSTTTTTTTQPGGSSTTTTEKSTSSANQGGDPTKPIGGDSGNGDGGDLCAKNPELQICKGGMNEETTQKKVEGHLEEIKTSLNPEEDGPDTKLQQKISDYEDKANQHKRVFDQVGESPNSDPHGILDWALIPTVPQTTCTPYNGTFMGKSINFDWCDELNKVRDLAGYIFYVLTAFGLWRIVSGAHGGNA